jgi:hypothetical protein
MIPIELTKSLILMASCSSSRIARSLPESWPAFFSESVNSRSSWAALGSSGNGASLAYRSLNAAMCCFPDAMMATASSLTRWMRSRAARLSILCDSRATTRSRRLSTLIVYHEKDWEAVVTSSGLRDFLGPRPLFPDRARSAAGTPALPWRDTTDSGYSPSYFEYPRSAQ